LSGQEKLSDSINVQLRDLVQETRQDVKTLSSDFKADLRLYDENFKKEIKESNTEIRKINTKISWAIGAIAGVVFIGGILINGSLGKIYKFMEQSAKIEAATNLKSK